MWIIYLLLYVAFCIFICRFFALNEDIDKKDVDDTKPETR